MTRPIYFDASVLTAIALGDDTVKRIFAALQSDLAPPIISEFAWGEFVAALAARVRTRAVAIDDATQLLGAARRNLLTGRAVPLAATDIADATMLIDDFRLALKLPDAIHIAIARRLDAILISTNRQQVSAARTLRVDCINPLEETP